jgi:hypothetical protein
LFTKAKRFLASPTIDLCQTERGTPGLGAAACDKLTQINDAAVEEASHPAKQSSVGAREAACEASGGAER